ncbi:nitroreductase family protein [Wielerella bovis]|uniref:nitroreductase family protein n=1 Tax=Wielerella bovis TaxID=2917790 RepID=UPI0020198326|nr:nitroreductase family protein [Wielerella bovis]ULJ59340.1 nitroreductase family protein [Wielerella bovis]
MSVQTLQQIAEKRRTIYVLNKELPISQAEISQIVEHAVLHTPSSFNSQSTRAVVLFGAEHEKLWDIAASELRKIVPEDKFEPTANKLNAFKAGAGSILFFEDQAVVRSLQEQFPAYAANFPIWADHANAMTQYAIWTTLAAADVGANLQHYNPVIDAEVAKTWDIPANWTLRAQMVFGGIGAPAGEKTFNPLEERFKVYGAN